MISTHIIGIHGVPRSGTSWVAQILNSDPRVNLKFQPLFSYALKNFLNDQSGAERIQKFYELMEQNEEDLFLNMRDPNIHKAYPQFEKADHKSILTFKQVHHHYVLPNMMAKDNSLKLVLLVRNPLAVLSSWKKAPREFHPQWDFMSEWRLAPLKNQDKPENYFGFAKWKEAMHLFLDLEQAYPDRVYLLSYSALLRNPVDETNRLFAFLPLQWVSSQTHEFILGSGKKHDNDPNSIYKVKGNEDSGWEDSLPQKVIEEVQQDELFIELSKRFNW